MRLQSLPSCGWCKIKEESDGKVNWRKRKKKEEPLSPEDKKPRTSWIKPLLVGSGSIVTNYKRCREKNFK